MLEIVKKQKLFMDLEQIWALVSEDTKKVNLHIQGRLCSDVALVNQLGNYIVNSGGKRLRPLLVLLSTHACQYQGQQHINLAAVIEFIHTATLLHDDVVDASDLRRGNKTANALWGNEASVLVGDFLYSRSFEMMVEANDMRVMEILSHATNTIAEGEVLQLIQAHDPETTESIYMDVIRRKTAKLFEAAAQLGAVISDRSEQEVRAMATYGRHLGTAFQLIDDVLDYSSSADELGKNIGDDLAEGKPTLPLLYAMWNGNEEESKIIRDAIEHGGLDHIEQIKDAINSTGGIAYTAKIAEEEAELAIDSLKGLPSSEYLDALYALARFSVERNY